jgi:hypothetical protein
MGLLARSSRALVAGTAVVSLAAFVTACGPATLASAGTSGPTPPPLSVTWIPSYAAPDTPAAIQQDRCPQDRSERCQERTRPRTRHLGW